MTKGKIFLEGLVSGEELDGAYRKRNRKYVYKRIVKQDLTPYKADGWEKTGYGSKKSFRLRKLKDIGPGFEDEVWCTFKRMGFSEMNKDNNFSIPRYGTNLTKQIDVYAKDEQCTVLVECKAAEKLHTKSSLGTYIDQLGHIRHELGESIFSHYKNQGITKKVKVVWILALKNIDMSQNDLERAEKANIKVVDGRQVEYYGELSKHFGHSSKYQFLADMFPGMDIPDLIEPIPAIKGKMGKNVFYSFVMEPEKLLKIAYVAHRAKTNEESLKTYQRMARKSRLKKIANYIHEKEGIFPTSVVLNIETTRPLQFHAAAEMAGKNAVLGTLHIPNKYKTAWIIDGQHRLFAYSDLDEAETATLPVVAFENLDPDKQAKMFVDINGEQVKVPKNLLVDLWANMHWNSKNPTERLKALTSRLVKELDEHPSSALRDRIIKIEGRRTQTRNLTMTALSDELRKSKLLGSVTSSKAKIITPGPLFLNDLNHALVRAREIISGYFRGYIDNDENLKKQWEAGREGYICTNQGVIPLLRVLKAILDHLKKVEDLDLEKFKTPELLEKIWKYQEPVSNYLGSASPSIIREFRGRYGEGGYRDSAFALLKEINGTYNNFDPPGLQQYLQNIDSKNNPETYVIFTNIEKSVMNHIVKRLKEEYGSDVSQWFHKGVPKKVREDVWGRATDEGEYKYPEKYFDLIHWKEIINQNFVLFGEAFTIDSKPHDSKKKKLEWFEKVNKIRRIISHPPRGGVSDAQLAYLKRIQEELIPKLEQ